MAASFLRYELKGKARTRPDILRLVLVPCAQRCPCEASEQKWGQKPKSSSNQMHFAYTLNILRRETTARVRKIGGWLGRTKI